MMKSNIWLGITDFLLKCIQCFLEYEMMKEIDHPNVTRVIEIIENKFFEKTYLIMGWHDYPTLQEYRESLDNLIIPED